MSELDALFEADEDVSEEVDTEEATAEIEEADDSGEDDSTGDGATAAPDDDKVAKPSEEESWTKTAYLEEKRKRQERERELEELKRSMNQGKKEDIDLLGDPEKAAELIEKRAESKALKRSIELSRDLMMDVKPDYEEMEKIFIEMAKDEPSLANKMLSSPNPAKFAYETARKHKMLQDIGDPEAYREKVRQEVLAELTQKRSSKAPSLAKTTSAGGTKTDDGDESLTAILGR